VGLGGTHPGRRPSTQVSPKQTAKAEGDHLIAMQPVPPRASRTIYELDVSIARVLDLTNAERLAAIGITEEDFDSIPWEPCQRVAGAIAWLGHDGLLIPSVRDSDGSNLVIFTANQPPTAEIVVRGSRVIEKK
jgi:RES domain-containing protein